MGNTYGTWLPGDPRGFRTKHERQHIEGDYRNPPPMGKYNGLYDSARESMKREPVHLSVPLRPLVLDEFLDSFRKSKIEIASISVGKVHFHVLARFPEHDPRRYVGFAKQRSAANLRQAGHIGWGGLWGLKSECVPICDHRHFWKAFGYILDHAKQGSAVWSDPNRQPPPDEFPDPDGLLVE
jgi:hypothetical protein